MHLTNPRLIVVNVSRTPFGIIGSLNGREVEFCYATRMWAYTDGSGYAYGATSQRVAQIAALRVEK
jgi:hypothetical protein